MDPTNIAPDMLATHRRRVTDLATNLVDHVADAVDVRGPMSRVITLDEGGHVRRYKITVERV